MKPLDLTKQEEDLMEEMSEMLYLQDLDCKRVNSYRLEDLKIEISRSGNSGLIYKMARKKANRMFKSRKKGRW